MHSLRTTTIAAIATVFAAPAFATEPAALAAPDIAYTITYSNKQFEPLELVVPTGQKINLVIKNADTSPFEFESSQLHREKIVQPQSEVTVLVGPLKTGSYKYVDDFNRSSKGFITAK